jgi:hypothetical protein
MLRIVSDNDVRGLVQRLVDICQTPVWAEFWRDLECTLYSFEEFQLPSNAAEAKVWKVCQDNQLVLITANRNEDDPESLGTTIRQRNRPECLPVLTLADPLRVAHDRQYAEAVVERLLDILGNIDVYRGTGRLFLP